MNSEINEDMHQYLIATEYFDYQHPMVENLYKQLVPSAAKTMAVEIEERVRDNVGYNPYCCGDGETSVKGSYCCQHNPGRL